MDKIFLELHKISTNYDSKTTTTICPTTVALDKILNFDSDNSYKFFDTIDIPETIKKESFSGIPTDIHFGYRSSIKVLESYNYIQHQLKKFNATIIS